MTQHREDYQKEISGRTIGSYVRESEELGRKICSGKDILSNDTYAVEFAPDGEHYQELKRGKIDKMWDYFNFDAEITIYRANYKHSKFKLKNLVSGCIVGEK